VTNTQIIKTLQYIVGSWMGGWGGGEFFSITLKTYALSLCLKSPTESIQMPSPKQHAYGEEGRLTEPAFVNVISSGIDSKE
jgi:hypothetical protein